MKAHTVEPKILQPGDHVVAYNKDLTIKYIDGPDQHGAYDIHGVDQTGQDQIVIVTDLVTLYM
jgi:hypothetical protein